MNAERHQIYARMTQAENVEMCHLSGKTERRRAGEGEQDAAGE